MVRRKLVELWHRMSDEHGQTVAEYTVMLGVITVAIVMAVALLSDTEKSLYESASSAIGSIL